MDTHTIDTVRSIVHTSSVIVLGIVIIFLIVGSVKPHLLRPLLKEFAERKYVVAFAIFVCLLCGTIFTATESTVQSYESQNTKQSSNAPTPLAKSSNSNLQNPSREEQAASSGTTSGRTSQTASRSATGGPQPGESSVAQAASPNTQESSRSTGNSPAATITPAQPADNTKKCENVHLLFVCL
jgi:hypothetical protein